MGRPHLSVGQATELYAQYLNAPRHVLAGDAVELELFEEDVARARAALEVAWLEAKPASGC